MNQESIREYCKRLPHVTENVQWGNDLCFKVGGKMFCVMCLEASPIKLSFKASKENFVALQENEGIVPAPYMARASWVALQRWDALRDAEMKQLLKDAHQLVFESLTRKMQAELEGAKPATKAAKKTAKKAVKKSSKPKDSPLRTLRTLRKEK